MNKASGAMKYIKKPDVKKDYPIIEHREVPEVNTAFVKTRLADIVDIEIIRTLMENFYQLTNIGITISDHDGHVLVATGWQDICIDFHRNHPVASNYCIESDIDLAREPEEGAFKLHRCKNKMWNISTPIIVDSLHIGNLKMGQFFFDDEELPYDEFREQAHEFGFDEKEYIKALERTPRWNRETVEKVMDFYSKLTHLISSIGYSNLKLARTLSEKEALYESLRETENEIREYIQQAPDGIFVTNKNGDFIEVNNAACAMTEFSKGELLQTDRNYFTSDPHSEIIGNIRKSLIANKINNGDVHIITKSGRERIWTVKTITIKENRYISFVQDVTEKKHTEEERDITIRILNIFNTTNDFEEIIQSVVELLKSWSGCEAVGIRIKDG